MAGFLLFALGLVLVTYLLTKDITRLSGRELDGDVVGSENVIFGEDTMWIPRLQGGIRSFPMLHVDTNRACMGDLAGDRVLCLAVQQATFFVQKYVEWQEYSCVGKYPCRLLIQPNIACSQYIHIHLITPWALLQRLITPALLKPYACDLKAEVEIPKQTKVRFLLKSISIRVTYQLQESVGIVRPQTKPTRNSLQSQTFAMLNDNKVQYLLTQQPIQ